MMQAMRIVTALLVLSAPAFALDVTLGEKVAGTSTLQSFDNVDALTVKSPSGRTWSAKSLHSVSTAIDPKLRTVRNVAINFGPRFKSWDEAVNRMDELAKQIGASDEERQKWLTKFRGKPQLGAQRWFPNFSIGGCEFATITITPRADTRDWAVNLEFLLLSPEEWARNPSRPATCPAVTSR